MPRHAAAAAANSSVLEVRQLASASESERAAGVASLESTQDVELAVACVGPLIILLSSPAAEVGVDEYAPPPRSVRSPLL